MMGGGGDFLGNGHRLTTGTMVVPDTAHSVGSGKCVYGGRGKQKMHRNRRWGRAVSGGEGWKLSFGQKKWPVNGALALRLVQPLLSGRGGFSHTWGPP